MRKPVEPTIRAAALLLVAACGAACGGGRGPEPPTRPVEPAGLSVQQRAIVLAAEDRRRLDPALLAALGDESAELRALAARAAGRIGDPGAFAPLVTAAGDPEPSVRAEALFALGRLGGTGAFDAIAARLDDPDADTRVMAISALGLLHDPAGATLLSGLLADPDPRARAAAALACRGFEDSRCDVDGLIGLSASPDRLSAASAAAALSAMGAATLSIDRGPEDMRMRTRVRDHLVELSTHPDAGVRLFVARGLVAPTRDSEVAVFARLLGDDDLRVRLAAIRSLAFTGAPFLTDMQALMSDEHSHIRWMALDGMGRIGGDLAVGTLVDEIIKRKVTWLRERAVRSLIQADATLASRVANGLSRDPTPEVRRAAAGAAGGGDSPEARAALERARVDPDARTRAAAVPAIAGTAGRISESLAEVIDAEEPVIRAAVARVAGQRLRGISSEEPVKDDALAVLERLWSGASGDPGPLVRFAVLRAASRLGRDERARPLLSRGLDDTDRRVRLRAIRYLEESFGEDHSERAGPGSDLPLEHYEEIARWAARPRAAIVTVQREGFRPGRLTLRLDTRSAPLTSFRFAQLAADGFYDSFELRRVVPDALVETGDVSGDASAGALGGMRDELSPGGFPRGAVGMSSAGPDVAGGSWFVTLSDQPYMVERFTRFGHVIQNLDGVVGQLHAGDRIVKVEVYEGDGTEPLPPL
jgi:HEAT repeat protein